MPEYLCHEQPDLLALETRIVDARPGRVRVEQSPFYPGGGGQLPDRGSIRWRSGEAAVTGFELVAGQLWHLIDEAAEIAGPVELTVDRDFRMLMRQLHTDTHVLNAFVFQTFDGALVTGVQMYDDGSARMDFDLQGADNDRLRALEAPINAAIASDLRVTVDHVAYGDARQQHGLIRSKSVAPPPTADGRIRIVDIAGLDRQACGGTHLDSTGASPPIRILKIDNKGRHNRRVRMGIVGSRAVPA